MQNATAVCLGEASQPARTCADGDQSVLVEHREREPALRPVDEGYAPRKEHGELLADERERLIRQLRHEMKRNEAIQRILARRFTISEARSFTESSQGSTLAEDLETLREERDRTNAMLADLRRQLGISAKEQLQLLGLCQDEIDAACAELATPRTACATPTLSRPQLMHGPSVHAAAEQRLPTKQTRRPESTPLPHAEVLYEDASLFPDVLICASTDDEPDNKTHCAREDGKSSKRGVRMTTSLLALLGLAVAAAAFWLNIIRDTRHISTMHAVRSIEAERTRVYGRSVLTTQATQPSTGLLGHSTREPSAEAAWVEPTAQTPSFEPPAVQAGAAGTERMAAGSGKKPSVAAAGGVATRQRRRARRNKRRRRPKQTTARANARRPRSGSPRSVNSILPAARRGSLPQSHYQPL